ncbi:MAG: hypothetical protein WAK33_18445 [Silvibacterium sp.]
MSVDDCPERRQPHPLGSGCLANLVLLRADPLADIHSTTQIQAVWLRGEYFDQAALVQLLAKAKEQASRH